MEKDEFGSHRLVLAKVLKRVSRSVLELGAGDYSTPLIHTVEERGVKILTIEDNPEWFDKYKHLKTDLHDFRYIDSGGIQEFYDNDDEQWELVFVDNGTWEARIPAIRKYSGIADYMVIHDSNYFPDNNIFGKTLEPTVMNRQIMGRRDYSDIFRYWVEFFVRDWGKQNPPTLLASNIVDVKDFIVEGMHISNKSIL